MACHNRSFARLAPRLAEQCLAPSNRTHPFITIVAVSVFVSDSFIVELVERLVPIWVERFVECDVPVVVPCEKAFDTFIAVFVP